MIPKAEKTYPFMWEVEGHLEDDFCDVIIDTFERDERKEPGVTAAGKVDTSMKNSIDTMIDGDLWDGIEEQLHEQLGEVIVETQYLDGLKTVHTGYNVQKTPADAEVGYDWHTDTQYTYSPDGRLYERVLTFIWYLNDDFEEGGTEFNDCFVEAKKGKLLLFAPSSTMIHKGIPPKGGDKYILTGWLWSALPIYGDDDHSPESGGGVIAD